MAKPRLVVALFLFISMIDVFYAVPEVSIAGEDGWSAVDIPAEGENGGWVLAEGSDVQKIALADDGTLYAGVCGLEYTLYKSTDGGYSWSHCGTTDDIVDIAVAEDGSIYYISENGVHRSNDGGDIFQLLASNPAPYGGNVAVTSFDVASSESGNIIVAGTSDMDADEYGGVYVLEGGAFPRWFDTGIGAFDVYAVAFSPDFENDRQVVAVVTDETDSFVVTRVGSAGWGQTIGNARLGRDNSGDSIVVAVSADIAFSDGNSYIQFVAVDTGIGDGDVYAVCGKAAPGASEAVDLNIGYAYGLSNVDVASLSVCGKGIDAVLLAGIADDGQIYRGTDGGGSWARNLKKPTGQFGEQVIMAADFATSGIAYAATGGAGSALSVTTDGGVTWNQLGLIDTRIDTIIDLSPSPEYERDGVLFMLTWGDGFSLWRRSGAGNPWQRVFSSALGGVECIDFVELSPQYGGGSRVVFLAGSGGGNPVVWWSVDDGQSFTQREAPLAIDQWVVADDTTLFIAGYNGTNGLVCRTSDGGLSYSSCTVTGNQSISSVVLSPGYYRDKTVLVGNSNGWMYLSDDNGRSFMPLPMGAASPPLTGCVTVAFGSGFGDNNTVYAASDSPGGGIHRFIVGVSNGWESIDGSLSSGGMIGGLAASDGGVLYATNFQQVDTADSRGGMERCLEAASGKVFETVTRGLDNGATLVGLWLCDGCLWSIDTTNARLMIYCDSLSQPVRLVSPYDRAEGIGTVSDDVVTDVRLDWEALDDATGYLWQLDDDDDFYSIPDKFEGTTAASSVGLPQLEAGTTYYWRVRAVAPLFSPWSEEWSFTTGVDEKIAAPWLDTPPPGATGMPVKPVFRWSAVAGAEGYELMVCAGLDFGECEIIKVGDDALPVNIWKSDVALGYNSTYYWRVRAVAAGSSSTWSAVGVFVTGPEPETDESTITTTTTTLNLEPPSTTYTTTTSTTVFSTVVTTTTLEPTVELQPPPTPLLNQLDSDTPEWLYYAAGSAGAVIVALLAVILGLLTRRC